MKTLLAILLVASTTLGNSLAQDDYKIPVKLMISGKTGLEGQIRSYFSREFRAIGDIEVTEQNEEKESLLGISIVVMEPSNKAGTSMGYIISIAVTDRTPIAYLGVAGMSMTTDKEKQNQFVQFFKSLPKDGILVNHILQTLDSSQLPETCRALAAQLDGSNIEGIRKQRAGWQKLMNNQKK